MESAATWYLMKNEDGSIFGPITFDQLHEWASDAQVSPLDKVSSDEKTWMKAPMVPELGMDYLIEVSPDQFYGPTTLGAVREFLQIGEINGDTPVTNCRDGSVVIIKDIPELQGLDAIRKNKLRVEMRDGRLGDLIEFSRAVHAEMDAVFSAGRKGVIPSPTIYDS